MKISIIIPTYNRVDLLKNAIDSILKQTYTDFEIIVVDDGSKDTTDSLMDKYISEHNNIKFIKKENNSGASDSRRIGFIKSTGEYVVFFDDDDHYTNSNLFLDVSEKFAPDISLVYTSSVTNFIIKNEIHEKKLGYSGKIDNFTLLKKFQLDYIKPNSTFTAFFNRSNLLDCGIMDMQMINDSSLFLISMKSDLYSFVIDESYGSYNIHGDNITYNINADFLVENIEEKLKIFKDSKLITDYPQWFSKQFMTTIRYYISFSKPNLSKLRAIMKQYSDYLPIKDVLFIYIVWLKNKII